MLEAFGYDLKVISFFCFYLAEVDGAFYGFGLRFALGLGLSLFCVSCFLGFFLGFGLRFCLSFFQMCIRDRVS